MPLSPDTAIKQAQVCLLAGAIGDALGAPVEFMSSAQVIEQFWGSRHL